MAINPETQYPGKISPATPAFPYGQAQNITLPGDGTGTPWEAALVNDLFGFQQALLDGAGIVPTGTPDEVGASQYLQALKYISGANKSHVAAMVADDDLISGMLIRTIGYYDGWAAVAEPVCGAFYSIATLAEVRAAKVDGAWVPDEQGDHTLNNGNIAVLLHQYEGFAQVEQYGAKGDGVTDDSAAKDAIIAYLTTIGSGVMQFSKGDFLFDNLLIPAKVSILGLGRHITKVIITGDGGGAIGQASNGGIQAFNGFNDIRDITFSYNNPLLEGLLNISQSGSTAIGRIHLENVDLAVGVSVTDVDCVAVYLANLVQFSWLNGQIGTAPNFKQDMIIRGFFNGNVVKNVSFRPHAEDLPNSVYHSINPQLDIEGATQASSFENCNFAQGPNGVKVAGQGVLKFANCYYSDGNAAVNFWLPNTVVLQGDLLYPSASVTGDSTAASADLINVSSTANLYIGQKIVAIGAGVASADLDTRIIDIVGTTVTMATVASTTTVGTGVYYPDYSGHGYLVSVAGTSGAAAPVFPTVLGATVADNTATLKEYGPCAWHDFNTAGGLVGKSSTVITSPYMASNVVGICAIRTGSAPGAIKLDGGHYEGLDICGYFDGAAAVQIKGVNVDAYNVYGFLFTGASGGCRENEIGPNYWHNITNGADVVAHPTSNNLGGILIGNGILTGGGAQKIHYVDTKNPDPIAKFTGRMELEGGILFITGANSPEGVYTAPVGSTFSRTNGGAGTSFYIKESGTGNTGWVAK